MKRIIGLCVLMLSFILVPQVEAAKDDITGHWAEDHMRALAKRGIMQGTGPNQYSPEQTVSRAEFATLISRTLSLPASEQNFSDLGDAHITLQEGVKKAAGAKIVLGGTDGKFRPNDPVSRQEMAVMIDRAMKYKGKQSTKSALTFADSASILYKEEVGRVAGAGIIKGADGNLFLPWENSKRAAAATMLSRMISHIEGVPLVVEKPKPEPPKPPKPEPQKLPLVVIDPGHGGRDSGAVGGGLMEKELVLDVALRMKPMFQQKGIPVAYTRETDVFVEIPARVEFAKEKNADLFVSIHANSYTTSSANGTETFYHNNSLGGKMTPGKPARHDSKDLAKFIQKRLLEKLKLKDRTAKHGNYHVVRETPMPAVLAELGFISNPSDREKLKKSEYRQKSAEAIYLGIVDYLKAKGYKL